MSIYYKFAKNANDLPTEKLEAIEKELLKQWGNPDSVEWNHYGMFGLNEVTRQAVYLIAGYSFNLKSVLKKFVVKNQWNDVHLYYAPNKTALRTCGIAKKNDKIMEVPIDW